MSKVDIDSAEFQEILSNDSKLSSTFDRVYDFAGIDFEYTNSLFALLRKLSSTYYSRSVNPAQFLGEYMDILLEAIYEAPNIQTIDNIVSRFNLSVMRDDTIANLYQNIIQVIVHFQNHLSFLVLESPKLKDTIELELQYLNARSDYYYTQLVDYQPAVNPLYSLGSI